MQTKFRAERQQLSVRLGSPGPDLVGACSSASSPCHHAPLASSHCCQAHLVSTQPRSTDFPQLQAGGARTHGQPPLQTALCQSAWQASHRSCALTPITGLLLRVLGRSSGPSAPGCGWWSHFFPERCCSNVCTKHQHCLETTGNAHPPAFRGSDLIDTVPAKNDGRTLVTLYRRR